MTLGTNAGNLVIGSTYSSRGFKSWKLSRKLHALTLSVELWLPVSMDRITWSCALNGVSFN